MSCLRGCRLPVLLEGGGGLKRTRLSSRLVTPRKDVVRRGHAQRVLRAPQLGGEHIDLLRRV